MNPKENFRKILPKEKKPFEPNERQQENLTIAAGWKQDGTPWWQYKAMWKALGGSINPLKTILLEADLNLLVKKQGLESMLGLEETDTSPVQFVPQASGENEREKPYYQVTEGGNKMRGRIR